MKQIGIIGGGIAGLHLGLFLRKQGMAATIYTERTPEQPPGLRASRTSSAATRSRANVNASSASITGIWPHPTW